MVSREDFIKEISTTVVKKKVLKLTAILKKQNFALKDLIDLTFSMKNRLPSGRPGCWKNPSSKTLKFT